MVWILCSDLEKCKISRESILNIERVLAFLYTFWPKDFSF
jgi:hypothetical protein